jgi:hypothetical protein
MINSNNQLVRLSKGLVWNGVNNSAPAMVFNPLANATGFSLVNNTLTTTSWNGSANGIANGTDANYQVIGDQVFRLEYCFLVQTSPTGTQYTASAPPTTTKAYYNDSPWVSPYTTSPNALRDVTAIVVTIAILDNNSRTIAGNTALQTAASSLADDTFTSPTAATTTISLPLVTWKSKLQSSGLGLPQAAASQVRFYQRYCYLNHPMTRKMGRATKGSALVIVLFFVILLTIVTLAFLGRSLTAVKVSASSAGEVKSKILASSASDIIIGDLKQEIVAGSASVGTDARWPVYTPNSNLTAIPFQNGVPSGNVIPNLVSRSVSPANTSGAAKYVPYTAVYTAGSIPPNRAASDPTAPVYTTSKVNSATPSLNGRFVSPAEWNAHYLIPRQTQANPSTTTDSTPISTFVPPDWVIVTRNGASSVTWSSGTGGLNDPTLTNTNFAVGRYAYAVYNEGGLLDMNVAGYPGTDVGSGSIGLTPTQVSRKGSLGLADLTQLPVGAITLPRS